MLNRVWLFGDPMDCSPPGSSVHGISQAGMLEWVAISSHLPKLGIKPKFPVLTGGFFTAEPLWKPTLYYQFSLSVVSDSSATPWTAAYQAPLPMGFSRQEYWGAIAFSMRIETVPFFLFPWFAITTSFWWGKQTSFWQPWWERRILHLPRLGAGGPSLEGMLKGYTWVRQEALGSHTPVTTGQAGLEALPLSFWSPRALLKTPYKYKTKFHKV